MYIDPKNLLLLYHNEIVIDVGVAYMVRGFRQDKITASWYNGNYGEFPRNGIFGDKSYTIKIVALPEWESERNRLEKIIAEKHKEEYQRQLQIEKENEALLDAAEIWFEKLTPHEQNMVRVLNHNYYNECKD